MRLLIALIAALGDIAGRFEQAVSELLHRCCLESRDMRPSLDAVRTACTCRCRVTCLQISERLASLMEANGGHACVQRHADAMSQLIRDLYAAMVSGSVERCQSRYC